MSKKNNNGGGRRYDSGKNRLGLFPAWAYAKIGEVYTKGANKYTLFDEDGNIIDSGDNNWMKGMPWSKVMHCLERHYNAFKRGKDFDIDPNCQGCKDGNCNDHTGAYHMAQVVWNAVTLLEYYRIYPQGDDRIKPFLNIPKIGLDLDGVIADWFSSWKNKYYSEDKKITTWHFDYKILDRFREMKKNNELDEFYLNIKPLIKAEELPFVPHCYITSRPVSTEITIEWLEKNNFPARPVYSIPMNTSKIEVAKNAGVEIFVEDSFDNFVEFNKNGITCYLMDQDYNKHYDVGHFRIKSLKDIPIIQS